MRRILSITLPINLDMTFLFILLAVIPLARANRITIQQQPLQLWPEDRDLRTESISAASLRLWHGRVRMVPWLSGKETYCFAVLNQTLPLDTLLLLLTLLSV